MAAAELSDCEHFLAGEKLSGGIAGVADQYGAGGGGELGLEPGYVVQGETFVDVGVDGLQGDAVKVGESLVIGVEGFDDDNLFSRARRNLHRHGERLASSHGHQQFRGLQFYAYLGVVLLAHSLAQLCKAGRIGIGDVVQLVAAAAHRGYGAVGGLDVGRPHVEMVNFDAGAFCRFGERDQLPYGRGRHIGRPLGYFRHYLYV